LDNPWNIRYLQLRNKEMVGLVDVYNPHKSDKGLKNGSCNREACQRPGATWFNRGTDRFYCEDCARLINRANPDARRVLPNIVAEGEGLCIDTVYDLFLDDERTPREDRTIPRRERKWKIVRNYEDAVAIVEKFGVPRRMSLDYNLGCSGEKSGLDFAIWFVEWCKNNGWPGFDFSCHSGSFEGQRLIETVIGAYLIEDKPGENNGPR
jgi:hypothetical protein